MATTGDNKGGINILDPKVLLEYAQDRTDSGRQRLVGAVSDFFEDTVLSMAERNIAKDILLGLVRQAEKDLRQALSDRFADSKMIPHDIIVFLANDEISIAEKILLHSPILKDLDFLRIIAAKENGHWKTIAQRETLTPIVADRLIDTGDKNTLLSLMDNIKVEIKKSSMKKMIKTALKTEELQTPLLRRPEIDPDLAIDLYMVVGQALRQAIAERFTVSAASTERAIENLVQEFSNEAKNLHATTEEMILLSRRLNEYGDLTIDLMIKTLRRSQFGFFAALFAEKTGLKPQQVIELIQQEGGQPFVVACRHLKMMKAQFASMFLLSRGIRTGDRILDQRELSTVLRHFDLLKDHDVQRFMQMWTKK